MSLDLQKQRPEVGETNVAIWKCDRAGMGRRDKLSTGGRAGWCDCTGLPRGVEAEAKGLVLVGICSHGEGGSLFSLWNCQKRGLILPTPLLHVYSFGSPQNFREDRQGLQGGRSRQIWKNMYITKKSTRKGGGFPGLLFLVKSPQRHLSQRYLSHS